MLIKRDKIYSNKTKARMGGPKKNKKKQLSKNKKNKSLLVQ